MTNKEIARTFQFLANIMELHGENRFKIRSYQNAYIALRKLDRPLSEMSMAEIEGIKGVGKAISSKIQELLESGKMATLEKYRAQTPEGIQEMLQIKGFGPKKIRTIWKDLGAETIGELLYAVNENRLIELKGFGKKTQDQLKEQLEYYQRSRNRFHFAALENSGLELLDALRQALPSTQVQPAGAWRRRANTLERMDVVIAHDGPLEPTLSKLNLETQARTDHYYQLLSSGGLPVRIHPCRPDELGTVLFRQSAADDFLEAFERHYPEILQQKWPTEAALFAKVGLPFIAPELREEEWALDLARQNRLPELIEETDIRGVIHAHTDWSDGLHSLRDMAEYARELGYEYIGITDHSKAAFYANGLSPERVLAQMKEIDALNLELAPFRIFKGIECDILNDGSLDYDEELQRQFDFIIASVHTNLRMDEEKATQRLLRAIENPYTTILGHPTGRLLLSRQGYPIDHQRIIDACATHGVAIELNANPFRLDLDWSWIPAAIAKGVPISINPDAHSRTGIHDIHYGVLSARKGGLSAVHCLNSGGREGFAAFLAHRMSRHG